MNYKDTFKFINNLPPSEFNDFIETVNTQGDDDDEEIYEFYKDSSNSFFSKENFRKKPEPFSKTNSSPSICI